MVTESRLPTPSTSVHGQATAWALARVMYVTHTVGTVREEGWEAAKEQRDTAFVRECPFQSGC